MVRQSEIPFIEEIRNAVLTGRYLVSRHARQRMAERHVRLWQLESSMDDASILSVDVQHEPHPLVNLSHELPDGMYATAVWAWLPITRQAMLVTVFIEEGV
ncbi:hypothetical protein GC163_15145 [bacterium]|nr:hypothetical protein [bacterium]